VRELSEGDPTDADLEVEYQDSFLWSWLNASPSCTTSTNTPTLTSRPPGPTSSTGGSSERDTTAWVPSDEGVRDGVMGFMVWPNATTELHHEFVLVVLNDPAHRSTDHPYYPNDGASVVRGFAQDTERTFHWIAVLLEHPDALVKIDRGLSVFDGAHTYHDPDAQRPASLRRLCGDYWCASRYAVITDTGTLPRSLTVNPVWRAQERISALLGAAGGRAARVLRDFPASAPATPALVRGFELADRFPRVVRCWVSLLVSAPSLETTSVTPYRAPRTRSASSRGSLESTVSLKAFLSAWRRWPPARREIRE
jgi:hypothetical protein